MEPFGQAHSANIYFWIFVGSLRAMYTKSGYELKMNFLKNTPFLKKRVSVFIFNIRELTPLHAFSKISSGSKDMNGQILERTKN